MTKRFLLAVAISILAVQLPMLLTPILAGNFIGGAAIAAVTLCAPVQEIFYTIDILLVSGAAYLATEFISTNDTAKLNQHFTVSALSALVVAALLAVALLLFNEPLTSFLCNDNAELKGMVSDYLCSVAWAIVPSTLFIILSRFYQAEGLINTTIVCNVVVSLLVLLLSVIFLRFFNLGIISFSLAIIISHLAGSAYYLAVMKSQSSYRLAKIGGRFFSVLKTNIQQGYPLVVDDLFYILFYVGVNFVIVNAADSNGAVIWGIVNTFITLARTACMIVSESMITLANESCSIKDYKGCRYIVGHHRRIIFIFIMLCLAVVELFPGFVMRIFGEPGLTDAAALLHLRIATTVMIIMGVAILEVSVYYVLKQTRKYIFFQGFLYLSVDAFLFAFAVFDTELVWWGFLASTLFSVIVVFALKRDSDRQMRTLANNSVNISMSIFYDFSTVRPAIDSVRDFLTQQGADGRTIDAMEHCVDELSYNIIKHGSAQQADKYFDITAAQIDGDIIISFKYGGKPFNPIIQFSDTAAEAAIHGAKPQIALRLFNHYALLPWYHYGYGINNLSMMISPSAPCNMEEK